MSNSVQLGIGSRGEMAKIVVEKTEISIIQVNEEDFFSLTDIAKFKSDEPNAVIGNWMRNRNTIEYLGLWETLNNPNFKPLEFEGFRCQAGLNTFVLPLKSGQKPPGQDCA